MSAGCARRCLPRVYCGDLKISFRTKIHSYTYNKDIQCDFLHRAQWSTDGSDFISGGGGEGRYSRQGCQASDPWSSLRFYQLKVWNQWMVLSRLQDNSRRKQLFSAKTWCFPNPNQVVLVPKPSTAMRHQLKALMHLWFCRNVNS